MRKEKKGTGAGAHGTGASRMKLFFAAAVLIALVFAAYIALPKPDAGSRQVAFFAYGANLDPDTMRARAGGFENAAPATLPGFAVAFQTNRETEFGVANLVESEISHAAGAVYWLTEEQAALLEKSAGARGFYVKKNVRVKLADGREADAVTYVLSGSLQAAPPSRPYLLAATKGLEYFGFGQGEKDAIARAAAGTD